MSSEQHRERRIVHALVVTLDDAGAVLEDAEVAYSPATGLITYVGPGRGPAHDGDLDAAGAIVMPGLVNAHTHSGMSLLRGYCDDCDLPEWLRAIRDFETLMSAEDIRAGLRLAMVEMIRGGTTAFADMFRWDAPLLAEVIGAGMRVLAAQAIFGYDVPAYPGASAETGRDALDATERLAAEFAGDPLVRIAFGPHAPYTCPPQLLCEVAERARRAGVGVHIHLAETAGEVADCLAAHGRTPIALAQSCGLFGVPALVAHATHADAQDAALLARHGAAVAHNPVSNLKLGAGIAPLPELRAAGVTLGLGTDSAASNNSLDLFEEVKIATVVQRGAAGVPDLLAGVDLLRMATRGGATALGFDSAGVLAAGRAADLAVVDTSAPHAVPMHSATSFLAFAAHSSDVRHVVVAGRELLRDGVLLTLDEAAVRADAAQRAGRIAGRLAASGATEGARQ